MDSIIDSEKVVRLADLTEAIGEKAKFSQVIKNDNGEILLVVFGKDVVIPAHHVPCDVLVQVLEGEMDFTIKGETDKVFRMKAGDFIRMTPGTVHSLKGVSPVKITVTKINA